MSEPGSAPAGRPRAIVLVMVAATCLIAGAIYVALAASRSETEAEPAMRDSGLLRPGRLLFQNVVRDRDYAHLAVAALTPGAQRTIAPLVCERVYYAGGRGLCMTARHGIVKTSYEARIFDAGFNTLHRLVIPGVVSRARVSADGRYGSTTGFINGESYEDPKQFSTHTTLIDMASGREIADLEQFTATKDGKVVDDDERDFWGVTFGTGGRFYATMATGGQTYLMEGDIAARTMRAIRRNVECPSLSPDGTRIAYKKRVGGPELWRLHVLDLGTGKDTALAEKNAVDDQAEWLDDTRVAYGRAGDVWSVPADGSGTPVRLQAGGLSPVALQ